MYSYGILLMETFTGKKPTDEMFAGEMNLKWWVRESLITHEVIEVIDENLLGQRQEDDLFLGKKDCILSHYGTMPRMFCSVTRGKAMHGSCAFQTQEYQNEVSQGYRTGLIRNHPPSLFMVLSCL